MVRPFKRRRVAVNPEATYFKPRAIPLSQLEEVNLAIDELEALKLCDLEGMEQTQAAQRMGISQSTLQRIIQSARSKVAEALTQSKAIQITKSNS